MNITLMVFVYDKEAPVIPPCIKHLRQVMERHPEHSMELVLVEDAAKPLPKVVRKEGCRIIKSHTDRHGNLRSFEWIKEQVRLMYETGSDVVFKIDPDSWIADLTPFLKPFDEGFRGLVGYTRLPPCSPHTVVGACYAVHRKGLELMNTDIQTLWNTEWMDVLADYLRLFTESFTFLPVSEDYLMGCWFYHRAGLHCLPHTTAQAYDWNNHRMPGSPVVLMGNPGPECHDKSRHREIIAQELEKIIPIPGKLN